MDREARLGLSALELSHRLNASAPALCPARLVRTTDGSVTPARRVGTRCIGTTSPSASSPSVGAQARRCRNEAEPAPAAVPVWTKTGSAVASVYACRLAQASAQRHDPGRRQARDGCPGARAARPACVPRPSLGRLARAAGESRDGGSELLRESRPSWRLSSSTSARNAATDAVSVITNSTIASGSRSIAARSSSRRTTATFPARSRDPARPRDDPLNAWNAGINRPGERNENVRH